MPKSKVRKKQQARLPSQSAAQSPFLRASVENAARHCVDLFKNASVENNKRLAAFLKAFRDARPGDFKSLADKRFDFFTWDFPVPMLILDRSTITKINLLDAAFFSPWQAPIAELILHLSGLTYNDGVIETTQSTNGPVRAGHTYFEMAIWLQSELLSLTKGRRNEDDAREACRQLISRAIKSGAQVNQKDVMELPQGAIPFFRSALDPLKAAELSGNDVAKHLILKARAYNQRDELDDVAAAGTPKTEQPTAEAEVKKKPAWAGRTL